MEIMNTNRGITTVLIDGEVVSIHDLSVGQLSEEWRKLVRENQQKESISAKAGDLIERLWWCMTFSSLIAFAGLFLFLTAGFGVSNFLVISLFGCLFLVNVVSLLWINRFGNQNIQWLQSEGLPKVKVGQLEIIYRNTPEN